MSDDLARDPGTEPVDAVDAAETEAAVGVPAARVTTARDAELAPDASGLADASLLALLDRLAGILERSDLLELEVESGETGIVLRKVAALAAPATGAATGLEPSATHLADRGPVAADDAAEPPAPARAAVLAPLTGIFYASPSPGSAPFVAVGREVVVGQVIGLIEAMKLFNEIKSDKAGRVVRVVAENGALVKAKHPLLEVEPL